MIAVNADRVKEPTAINSKNDLVDSGAVTLQVQGLCSVYAVYKEE